MTMPDDDLDPIPVRRPPDDSTPHGRIEGRDRRKYARLWGIDLDIPPDDVYGYPGGQAEFDLVYKLMGGDLHQAEEARRAAGMSWRESALDLEEFAAAWRPPSESEMIEEEIAWRIAEERRQRDPDPRTRH
jgi:hypothetical protein